MFKENNKLPEVKYLMETQQRFQPIIGFLKGKEFQWNIINYVDYIRNLSLEYNGSVLFLDSELINDLECFAGNISVCIKEGGKLETTQEQYSEFVKDANKIVNEYEKIMKRHTKY